MGKIFFTADSHRNHRNIVRGISEWEGKKGCRDFDTIEEHDSYILNQINKYVKADDTLYHLGDVAMGPKVGITISSFREKINCKKICLILGNHDHAIKKSSELRDLFYWVDTLFSGNIAGRPMVLCHYSMKTWPWMAQKSIHLYGHSHGTLPDDLDSLSMDVGLDTELFGHSKYTPYEASEIFAIMDNPKLKQFVAKDHHILGTNPC